MPQLKVEAERPNTLVFLGFGFHVQNIELLNVASDYGIDQEPPVQQRVFATTKGMSRSDAAVVEEQIALARRGRPTEPGDAQWIWTNDGSCADLFATYWGSLTN